MTNLLSLSRSEKIFLICIAMFLFYASVGLGQNKSSIQSDSQQKFVHYGAGNPYLPLWEHLPDGEPRVLRIRIIRVNIVLTSLDHTI